jgi:uncharacterized cupredoxin-like copper-binding protein
MPGGTSVIVRTVALHWVLVFVIVTIACSGSDGGNSGAEVIEEFGPPDSTTALDLRDIAFSVEVLTGTSGTVLAIDLENTGQLEHDFTIDELSAGVSAAGSEHSRDSAVYVQLDRRASARLFLRLDQPGEFVFYCSVPGHRGAGMEGVLIVE